jgi:hypothetical protein
MKIKMMISRNSRIEPLATPQVSKVVTPMSSIMIASIEKMSPAVMA